MTNLTDLCITLAEKLGWENARLSGGSIVVDVAGDHRSVVVTDEDAYAFIAHAKAELAKRGWYARQHQCDRLVHRDESYVHVQKLSFSVSDTVSNKYVHSTALYEYDPTNPLSTAEAELKALIEALG